MRVHPVCCNPLEVVRPRQKLATLPTLAGECLLHAHELVRASFQATHWILKPQKVVELGHQLLGVHGRAEVLQVADQNGVAELGDLLQDVLLEGL
eukprot:525123-Alexandrium_andersonii.AAC.1